MFDIIAVGELLIDFTLCGISETGMCIFEQNPGGAVANVLAAAAKFGHKTAMIGKVGNDMHGAFLRETLNDYGIDIRNLIMANDVFTTLAFVSLLDGERSFSFARKPGADTCLESDEIDPELLKNTKILHIGSLSLTDEPARSATIDALRIAKAHGALISYDPNYRASLWPSEAEAISLMRSMLPYVDLMKLSDEETQLLTDYAEPEQAMAELFKAGVRCVCVTMGADGAMAGVSGACAKVDSFPVSRPIDTTGAGDAFWGGFLSSFLECGLPLDRFTLKDAIHCATVGNATASLCTQKRGGITGMPEAADVFRRMERSYKHSERASL